MSVLIHQSEDLKAHIKRWISQRSERQVILFDGPMGVGKTFIIGLICEELGFERQSHSPSFAIHNRYQKAEQEIHHLDLYRLESDEELESTGFWDIFDDSKKLILIEWAEKLNWIWIPKDYSVFQVRLEFAESLDSCKRKLDFEVKR